MYCFTAVDCFTRWPEVFPLDDIKGETVAHAFFSAWISRFECPQKEWPPIEVNSLAHRCSETYQNGLVLYRLTTTAYHPAAKSLVERFHWRLKAAIMCHTSDGWYEVLPIVLLGFRTAWKEDIWSSSAELIYKESLRILSDLFYSTPTEVIEYSKFFSRLPTHVCNQTW